MPVTESDPIAFLFTDIEGSTKLWESHPDAMKSVIECHDALLHERIAAHRGHVFKTVGDGFCAAFHCTADAVAAAFSIQIALAEAPASSPVPLHVRIAIHAGTAERRDGDYIGQPLNRVARLLAAAHGGQTLLSQAATEIVRDCFPERATVQYLGSYLLKGLVNPEHIYQLVHPALPMTCLPLHARRLKTVFQEPAPSAKYPLISRRY